MDCEHELKTELAATACTECGNKGLTLDDLTGLTDWIRPTRDARQRDIMRHTTFLTAQCPACGRSFPIHSTTLRKHYEAVAGWLHFTLWLRAVVSRCDTCHIATPDNKEVHA